MSNSLLNHSFENGWIDILPPPGGDYGWLINQSPTSWELSWIDIGEPLYDADDIALGVPECVHKRIDQLPPDQHPGGSDALILEGIHTYKIFHHVTSFGAELRQYVHGLEPGSVARLVAPMRIHDEDHDEGDAETYAAETGAWLIQGYRSEQELSDIPDENKSGTWVPLTDARKWDDAGAFSWFYHGDPERGDLGSDVIEVVVPDSGIVTAVLRVKSKWERPFGFFIDDVTLEAVPDDGGTTPPPTEDEGEGVAREPYRRIYFVADPTKLSPEEMEELYIAASGNNPELLRKILVAAGVDPTWISNVTIGNSYDDAGIGEGLVEKIAVTFNIVDSERPSFEEFFETHYSSTLVAYLVYGEWDDVPGFYWPTIFDGRVTHWFGEPRDGYTHGGIDLMATTGSPVFAAKDGIVAHIEYDPDRTPFGIYIMVAHENETLFSFYAHLQEVDSLITVGTAVSSGDTLGLANNTGNSFGSHLHFEIRTQDGTKVDPWLGLAPTWDGTLDVLGTECYLWIESLETAPSGGYARTTGVLNARTNPTSDLPRLGTVATSSVVRFAPEVPINGYRRCIAIVDRDDPEPTGDAKIGIHFSANNWEPTSFPVVFDEVRTLPGPKMIRVMTNHEPDDIARLARENPGADFVVRIYHSFDGPTSPSQFFERTITDLERTLDAIPVPDNQIAVEIHNEPNLVEEGLGVSWNDGSDFAEWLHETLVLLAERRSGPLYLVPGMSPGWDVPSVRMDDQVFSAQMTSTLRIRLQDFDGVACHVYWSQPFPMSQGLEHLDRVIAWSDGLPVYVTESSNNLDVITAEERARQYLTLLDELRKRPSVRGVMFFVVSGSGYPLESWLDGGGNSRGIAEAIADMI